MGKKNLSAFYRPKLDFSKSVLQNLSLKRLFNKDTQGNFFIIILQLVITKPATRSNSSSWDT